jgi:hypothetical protein
MGLDAIVRNAAAIGLTLGLVACGATHEYSYPSHDQKAAVLVQPAGLREPAEGRQNVVYLQGAAPPSREGEAAPASNDRIKLGRFNGEWNPAAIAWIGETTVNVCPLNGDRTVPAFVNIPVTETTHRTYRITTDCPPFLRASLPAAR